MVCIRVATPDDAESIRDIYAPFIEETTITFHTKVLPVAHYREQIQTGLRQFPWYVAEQENGELVGYAYASEHHVREAYRWSVNVSIYLRATHQRQGVGRQLYEILLATLKRQGYRMVHAGITMPNDASQKMHESLGFRHVGTFPAAGFKLEVWKDVGWWVLDLMEGREQCKPTAEPVPFSQVTWES